MPDNKPVIIVGAGWAGLAAAIELTRQRVPVVLLESAKQAGGRARSVMHNGLAIDNGQHLMLGAYQSTLEMLRTVGIAEHSVIKREPLNLHWLKHDTQALCIRAAKLPAPLHLAWGLFRAGGLSLRERLSALGFARSMHKKGFQLAQDCSVLSLLQAHGQSAQLITAIWEPLCLSALNTHVHEASAQIFLRTLGDAFRYSRSDSDLLLTRSELGAILPQPAMDYIETHGGNIHLGQRVNSLLLDDNAIKGVRLEKEELDCAQLVLATAHTTSRRLLQAHPQLQAQAEQLSQLQDRPICTVYLQYPPDTRLERCMQGSLNTLSQWIFDRRLYGQNGLMAVVISADGEHMAWDNDTLCAKVSGELASLFPHWPMPLAQHVIREKRATFACSVNVQQYRPQAKTPLRGLWLAGDYTDTGLPATLEGAVRSGLRCAQGIVRERHKTAA